MSNETFKYNYSAGTQEEVKRIRDKYTKAQEDKLERLRKLDKSVTDKATIVSLVFGITGALFVSFGVVLGLVFGLYFLGVLTAFIGIPAVAAAYPVYGYVSKKEREKIAPEIIRLSDELLK